MWKRSSYAPCRESDRRGERRVRGATTAPRAWGRVGARRHGSPTREGRGSHRAIQRPVRLGTSSRPWKGRLLRAARPVDDNVARREKRAFRGPQPPSAIGTSPPCWRSSKPALWADGSSRRMGAVSTSAPARRPERAPAGRFRTCWHSREIERRRLWNGPATRPAGGVVHNAHMGLS